VDRLFVQRQAVANAVVVSDLLSVIGSHGDEHRIVDTELGEQAPEMLVEVSDFGSMLSHQARADRGERFVPRQQLWLRRGGRVGGAIGLEVRRIPGYPRLSGKSSSAAAGTRSARRPWSLRENRNATQRPVSGAGVRPPGESGQPRQGWNMRITEIGVLSIRSWDSAVSRNQECSVCYPVLVP